MRVLGWSCQLTDAACRPHIEIHEEQVRAVAHRSTILRLQRLEPVVVLMLLPCHDLLCLLLLPFEKVENTLLLP